MWVLTVGALGLATVGLTAEPTVFRGTFQDVNGHKGSIQCELTVTDAGKALLAREGYDPVFGARPLKRVIQRQLLDSLSMELLAGKLKEGDKVVADAGKDSEKLIFRKG